MSVTAPEAFGTIPLPAPIGRRVRLGPFPSARDALKFAAYGAIGAVVAAGVGPLAWLPILGGGFLISVHKPEGRGLDERLADYVRWRVRSSRAGARFARARPATTRGGFARLEDGRLVGGLEAHGIPVTFLPAPEARRLFEQYLDLLRGVEDGCLLGMTVVPLPPGPYLPARDRTGPEEVLQARDGYAEMVRLLCRRRRRRVVHLLVWSRGSGPGSVPRLEETLAHLAERLAGMGVESRRLRSTELARAMAERGWSVREAP